MKKLFYVLAIKDIDTTEALTKEIDKLSVNDLLEWYRSLTEDLDELTTYLESDLLKVVDAKKVAEEISKEREMIKKEIDRVIES